LSLISSARQKAGALISGKVQMPFNEAALKKIGLQTISTERMGDRKTEQKIFNALFTLKPKTNATPEQKFNFYVQQLEDIWGMYKANQVSYLRAGSNGPFGMMVTAIEGMYVRTMIAIDANRHILEKLNYRLAVAKKDQSRNTNNVISKITAKLSPNEQTFLGKLLNNFGLGNDQYKIERKKEQLVRNFVITWLYLLMFEYVGKMGNFCWLLEDVNVPESFPIMSNQPIQQSYGGTTMDNPKGFDATAPPQDWGEAKYEKKNNKEKTE
jgi:hypothetical protein